MPAEPHEQDGLLPTTSRTIPAPVAKQKPDLLLWCCRMLNLVTAVCALLCAVASCLALFLENDTPGSYGLYDLTGQVLRVFGVLIAVLIVVVETEWQLFMAWVPTLDAWVGRGVLQLFEATLVYREATAVGGSDLHKSLQLYRSAACGSLLGCACVYLLGGMLCIGAIRKARYRREEALSRAQADLAALDRRRADLQRVLARAAQD